MRAEGRASQFEVDSAGIDGWHVGEAADPRTRSVGEKHGVDVPSIARQFDSRDYERFDLILAMDKGHERALLARASKAHKHKIRLMREYDRPEHRGEDVEDPYYGGAEGFERMYQTLEVCCLNLLRSLTNTERSAASGG